MFDAIAERAMHLCGASTGWVSRFDGELVHLVARANVSPEVAAALRSVFPMPPSRRSAAARAVLTHSIVHIPDVRDDSKYGIATQVGAAFRSVVAVPMLQKGKAIGAVAVGRPDPGPFSERQIALLRTFAAQAVIAIENVRLFNEAKEALERETATGEILRIISRSPTDVRPVFDAIVRSATRLCDGVFSGLFRFDGKLIHHVAGYNYTPEALEFTRRAFPAPPSRRLGGVRAILERAVGHIPDVELDPEYDLACARETAEAPRRSCAIRCSLMRRQSARATYRRRGWNST